MNDGLLVVAGGHAIDNGTTTVRPKDAGTGDQRNRILRILYQTLARKKEERLVPRKRKSNAAAKLLTSHTVFGLRAADIGQSGDKRLAWRQGLGNGERVARVQRVVADEGKKAAVHVIRPALGHNIDGRAAGAAQIGCIVGAVDLKFLYSFLAQREPHPAGIVIGFSTVHRHTVAPAVASIKGKTALGRLFDPEI